MVNISERDQEEKEEKFPLVNSFPRMFLLLSLPLFLSLSSLRLTTICFPGDLNLGNGH